MLTCDAYTICIGLLCFVLFLLCFFFAGVICECKHKNNGLATGPLCQETTRTFEGGLGASYIWLEKLVAYDRNVVQLEFTTIVADGLILYQGPLLQGLQF